MAVYYKFKSAKDFDSISIDGHFISVALLKERIFESKFGRGTGFDLVVANAQTNEEYLDEATLIPKNTSLLVRRVPVQRRMPIVTNREEPKVENNNVEEQPSKISFPTADSSVSQYPEGTEWDEFGNDLYAIPEVTPVQPDNVVQDTPSDKADEDSKIKALIDSSALDWQMQQQDGFGAGRGFGRGMGGRMMGGRGFGGRVGFERVGFERKTPPQGYICHRCEVPGHFIQHCPTNGDPNFDKRRMKNPTGIPKDMLVMNPDGPYALPGGAVAVMKPNEAAFNREVEGISSTRSVGELPPELHCPLCKEVMKDAVLTSKCCFSSFCDRCIRNHIISKSMCICGATNILADDLLPNKTVRDTINRILESNNSSAENAGSAVQIPDTASARVNQYKPPSPTVSATSKGGNMPPSPKENILDLKGAADSVQPVVNPSHQSLEKGINVKAADLSEVTRESMHEKEPKLQATVSHAEEEVQQKLPTTGEAGKKKKKKKSVVPVNGPEMQWRTSQDFPPENYMMPFPQSAYDGYWGGMQMGMDGYMPPGYNGMPPGYGGLPPAYPGAMPYMGYTPGPFDMPFGGVFPQEPFGGQGYMMPPVGPPQRDLSGGRGMSREEFEARKAGLRRKCENDRNGQRDSLKERERGREPSGRESTNNGDISSMKSKSRIPPTQETRPNNRIEETHTRERLSREIGESTRHGKNRPDHQDDTETAEHKASVFSRISFPEGGNSKKRKSSSSDVNKNSSNISNGHKDSDLSVPSAHHKSLSNGYNEARKSSNRTGEMGAPSRAGRKSTMIMEPDSSDDEEERHFKRRPARYEPQQTEWEQDERATKSSRVSSRDREREREHEREYERQRGHRHSHR